MVLSVYLKSSLYLVEAVGVKTVVGFAISSK